MIAIAVAGDLIKAIEQTTAKKNRENVKSSNTWTAENDGGKGEKYYSESTERAKEREGKRNFSVEELSDCCQIDSVGKFTLTFHISDGLQFCALHRARIRIHSHPRRRAHTRTTTSAHSERGIMIAIRWRCAPRLVPKFRSKRLSPEKVMHK